MPNHASVIIGFDPQGNSLLYDYGDLTNVYNRSAEDLFSSVTNLPRKYAQGQPTKIIVPNQYKNYTYSNFKDKYEKYVEKLGYKSNSTENVNFDVDNPWMKAAVQTMRSTAPEIGFDYNIPAGVMKNMMKRVIGIGAQESDFGGRGERDLSLFGGDPNEISAVRYARTKLEDIPIFNRLVPNIFKERRTSNEPNQKSDWELEIMAHERAGGDKQKEKEIYNNLRKRYADKAPSDVDTDFLMGTDKISKGIYKIKEIPQYAKDKYGISEEQLYGANIGFGKEVEYGTKAALVYMADAYARLKKKYPDLTNDQVLDLATVSFNSYEKWNSPEYVDYYIKNNKLTDDYLKRVKGYSEQYTKDKYQNGGQVLPEQPVQQELPYKEIESYPVERSAFKDPRVPRSADKSYYKSLYNTDVPKTLAKQYELWANTYKSPIGLKIDSYKDIYDTQAFFKSGKWKKGFKNIEEFRKPSHPMLGTINSETNTFIPDPKNINSNEEIASYILKENIPVKFREVERIPINPDGFAPGSATEFADKVIIPSGNITMKDMQEPILANGEMLMPGEEAQFDTDYVVEEKLPTAQDGLTVAAPDNTRTSMPIDPKFLEGAVQEAVAKEEFQNLPKEVQEKIILQQQINDPEFRNKNQGELYKGLTNKEKISNFMSDLGTEFAYAPRTLFTLEAPTIEEKLKNRSVRKDDLGEVSGNRGLSILDGLTWYMGGELFGAGLEKAGELSIPYLSGAEESAKKLISPIKGAIENYKSGINWAKDNPNWRKDHTRFLKDMYPEIRLVRQSEKDLRNKLIEEGKVTPTIKEKVERKVASTVDDLRTKAILPLGKEEAALIGKAQNKAFDEGVDIANTWFYPKELGTQMNPLTGNLDLISPGKLRPHIKTKIMGILDDAVKPSKELTELGLTTSAPVRNAIQIAMSGKNPYTLNQTAFNFNRSGSPIFKTHNLPMQEGLKNIYDQYVSGALSAEEARYLLSNFGSLGGVNFHGGPSVTYLNRGNYLKDPKKVFGVAAHETGHTTQKLGIESLEDAVGIALTEGQAPGKFYWRDAIAHAPDGYSYSIPNPISKIGKIAEEIMVPPNMSAENYVWHASPLEVHSELMAHRADIINKLKKQGNLSTEDAVQWLQEHEWEKSIKLPLSRNPKTGVWEYRKGSQGLITPQNDYISKLRARGFFKKGVTDKQILEFLKLFPAFTGVAAVGSAGIKD
jgi:hypothetical protein